MGRKEVRVVFEFNLVNSVIVGITWLVLAGYVAHLFGKIAKECDNFGR